MSKVFVPSVSMRRVGGTIVPALDFTRAQPFGEIVPVVIGDTNLIEPYEAAALVRARLDRFEPSKDFVLLAGDPVSIALCCAHLLKRFESIRVLKWERETQVYNLKEISV